MRTRDRYLSGILLILIGILIGIIITIYQQGPFMNDNAEVRITDVKRSESPAFSDDELEALDPRFLFKSVANEIIPTVVYIETVVPLNQGDMPDDEFHGNEEDGLWDRFFQRRARTVGSGVIISGDGYILTNNHVIDGAVDEGIRVVLNDKRMFKARIVGTDPTTDLAVIKIDARNLPSIVVGNSDQVDVGEWVLAIGNPFRLRSTVTAGIVSALGRDVQIINDQMRIESFIQTDAAINRGNSGGALVNTSGELIGINTAIASQSGTYQGYGFAVPSNLATKVAHDLIEYGEVRRALLGVTIASVDAIRAEELGMKSIRGVEIIDLTRNGTAEKSGLKPNDVILSVNGTLVNESNELQQKIAIMYPGEIVNLRIWRNGREFEKQVELGRLERADLELSANQPPVNPEEQLNKEDENSAAFDLGFRVQESAENDLLITNVVRGSEAHNRGLKEGYIIREVNNEKVEDLETLKDLIGQRLRAGSALLLRIETQEGAIGYYELKQ
jgi:Do/DeqQ family serine protease